MPRVASHEAVTPTRMSPDERSALADALFEAVGEVFDTDKATAKRLMIEPKSQLTRILLSKSEEGRVVGIFALHFFERNLRGVPVTILRVQSGMLRAYRGRSADMTWVLREVLGYTLANPGRALYGMGLMIHPSSYLFVARYAEAYWPKPDEPVPPEMLDFMIELADEFNLKTVDPRQPLVRVSTLKTRETEAERDYWRQCDKPAARFYVSMNPAYSERRGLLVLGRLSVPLLAKVAARFAREKAERAVEGAIATAQRLPLGARLIGPSEVRKRLRGAALFAGLDDASLEALVAGAEVVSLPTSTYLFREGDEGQDLYLVARGAVCVVTTSPDGEAMIDQLGAGALFGEIAMLAGGRRSASIRTAIPSTLVRVRGAALRASMAANAAVGEAIWGALAARIFDDHLRASGVVRELDHDGGAPLGVPRSGPGGPAPPAPAPPNPLDRAGRMAWIRRGRHEDLAPGASAGAEGDAFLMVLSGAVLIERGGPAMSAQAPIVLEADATVRVRAKTGARVVHVPPL
jgi:hypothetical protein